VQRAVPSSNRASRLHQNLGEQQLQTSSQVLDSLKDFLSSCPTERYLLASQPNAHATDIRGCSGTPHLCRAISNEKIRGQLSVSEVVGLIDVDALGDSIKRACANQNKVAEVHETKLAPLPAGQRRKDVLEDNGGLMTATKSWWIVADV
jgi:hypothetical protein